MKYSLHSICVSCTVLDTGKTKINCHFWPSRTVALTQLQCSLIKSKIGIHIRLSQEQSDWNNSGQIGGGI